MVQSKSDSKNPRKDENLAQLIQLVQERQQSVQSHLNELKEISKNKRWLSSSFSLGMFDPVRTKNMEKIVGHLHKILVFLSSPDDSSDSQDNSQPCIAGKEAPLHPLLQQLEFPAKLSPNQAWELADLLELELIRLGDNAYLYVLLTAQAELEDNKTHN